MQTEFVDDSGEQIPVDFEEKGIFSRFVHKIGLK